MATLYQRDGTFYLNYSINGQRVRKAVGNNLKEAEICLTELRYKISNGDISPKKPEVPIDLFFDQFLESCKSRLSEGTVTRYGSAIKHFRHYFTSHRPTILISQIGRGSVQEYVVYRQSNKPRPKAKTINLELSILRTALIWAVDNEWLEKNPASRIKKLKTTDTKSGQIINAEEIERLMEGCKKVKDGIWFRDLLIVFLNTGMRLGELLNLTWDDIDWDQELIKIQEKPGWTPKTYERNIPINKTVKDVLMRLKTGLRGYVFTYKDRKIEDTKPRKNLITLAKKVGLPHITRVHNFRHTFCSNLLMKGVDIPTVQALLGHRSWSTTMIYSHRTSCHTRKAIKILD